MLKQEKIDISQTNLALFGSPIEKEIKLKAAQGEPAWKTAGKAVGIEIWRIEKFQVVAWPKDQYGSFYEGDSYIVLHTYKQEDAIRWNIHFWLGEYTTLDEAGTAAYKTVELDDFLGGAPVQYREVQDSESETFLKLFPNGIHFLKGGIETGFKHVEPEKYKPRLLHIKGRLNKTVVREVRAEVDSLNAGDVFILDVGTKLYQFIGDHAGAGEKSKAAQVARAIDDQRGSNIEINIFSYNDKDAHAEFFWNFLGGKKAIKSAAEGGDDTNLTEKKKLFKLSDASGSLVTTEVAVALSSLHGDDVFILDAVATIFIWIGKGASPLERKSAFQTAQTYINGIPSRAKGTPIVRLLQGGENEEFHAHFDK